MLRPRLIGEPQRNTLLAEVDGFYEDNAKSWFHDEPFHFRE